MKEVIAVIRSGKDRPTKEALALMGISGSSTVRVYGRGRQRGLRYRGVSSNAEPIPSEIVVKYLPKKMISLVIPDKEVKAVIQTIIRVNQTGQYGDGKIFVLDVGEAYRIRTREKGEGVL